VARAIVHPDSTGGGKWVGGAQGARKAGASETDDSQTTLSNHIKLTWGRARICGRASADAPVCWRTYICGEAARGPALVNHISIC